MKKSAKIILLLITVVIIISTSVLLSTPTRLHFFEIEDHLLISEENDHLYLGIDFYASEIDHMASKNGHIYLYSLEDGSRCYAQYLYCKASFLERMREKNTTLYYYPLSEYGAGHGVAIDIKSDGSQVEYKCYTVAVYYSDESGNNHLLWKSNTYDPSLIK